MSLYLKIRKISRRRESTDESGQSLIEYLIIVALVAIGSISIIRSLGETVYVRFANITGALQHKNVDLQPSALTPDQFQKRGLDDFFKSATTNGPSIP